MSILLISKQLRDELTNLRKGHFAWPGVDPDMLWGVPFDVCDAMPFHDKTKPPIGVRPLDRFTEYDLSDGAWAVPAGLGEWIYEEVHCIRIDPKDLLSRHVMDQVSWSLLQQGDLESVRSFFHFRYPLQEARFQIRRPRGFAYSVF